MWTCLTMFVVFSKNKSRPCPIFSQHNYIRLEVYVYNSDAENGNFWFPIDQQWFCCSLISNKRWQSNFIRMHWNDAQSLRFVYLSSVSTVHGCIAAAIYQVFLSLTWNHSMQNLYHRRIPTAHQLHRQEWSYT